MKQVKAFVFLFAILSITIISCSKEEDNGTENPDIQTQLELNRTRQGDFTQVGKIHNEGLDYIFSPRTIQRIKDIAQPGKPVDTMAIASLIFQETNSFLKGKTIQADGMTISLKEIDRLEDALTVFAENKMDKYEDCKGTLEERKSCIKDIMKEFAQNPFGRQYIQMMSAGSVYDYSLDYWTSNEELFISYFRNQQRGWFSWVSMAVSDVQGAYSGAQIGAVGGPAGAIGGAVAFGLMGSALNAAVQAAGHAAQQ